VSPGYLFATLLWHDVLVKWNARTANGEHRIPALERAIDETLDAQTEKLAIQRRFVSDMREIWDCSRASSAARARRRCA